MEQDGQSHAEQKAQLEQEAKTSRQSISVLEAAALHDRAEIAQLEQQEEESQERTEELKAAAVDSRERLMKLQRQLTDQTDREDELNRDGVPDTGAETESEPYSMGRKKCLASDERTNVPGGVRSTAGEGRVSRSGVD